MSLNKMPVIGIVERTRKSPFFDSTVRWGVKGRHGNRLWDIIMEAGKKYDIAPATPSTIERGERHAILKVLQTSENAIII